MNGCEPVFVGHGTREKTSLDVLLEDVKFFLVLTQFS